MYGLSINNRTLGGFKRGQMRSVLPVPAQKMMPEKPRNRQTNGRNKGHGHQEKELWYFVSYEHYTELDLIEVCTRDIPMLDLISSTQSGNLR